MRSGPSDGQGPLWVSIGRSPVNVLWLHLRVGNIGRHCTKLTALSVLYIHGGGEYRKCNARWNTLAKYLPDIQGVLGGPFLAILSAKMMSLIGRMLRTGMDSLMV